MDLSMEGVKGILGSEVEFDFDKPERIFLMIKDEQGSWTPVILNLYDRAESIEAIVEGEAGDELETR